MGSEAPVGDDGQVPNLNIDVIRLIEAVYSTHKSSVFPLSSQCALRATCKALNAMVTSNFNWFLIIPTAAVTERFAKSSVAKCCQRLLIRNITLEAVKNLNRGFYPKLRVLKLENGISADAAALLTLKNMPRLESLRISSVKILEFDWKGIENNPSTSLQEIELEMAIDAPFEPNFIDGDAFLQFFKLFPNLRRICVEGCTIDEETATSFISDNSKKLELLYFCPLSDSSQQAGTGNLGEAICRGSWENLHTLWLELTRRDMASFTVRSWPKLTSLYLFTSCPDPAGYRPLLSSFSGSKVKDLVLCKNDAAPSLPDFTKAYFPELEKLELKRFTFQLEDMPGLDLLSSLAQARMPKLRHLEFRTCSNVTTDPNLHKLDMFPLLEALSIAADGDSTYDKTVLSVLGKCLALPNLKKLEIKCFTTIDLRYLFSIARSYLSESRPHFAVTSLNLYLMAFSQEEFSDVLMAASFMPCLKELVLVDLKLGFDGVSMLSVAQALGAWPRLSSISFGLSEQGAARLIDVGLDNWKALKTLRLSGKISNRTKQNLENRFIPGGVDVQWVYM